MSLDLKSNVHQLKLTAVKPFVSGTYEFEDFRLDAEHLMLYRNGEELSLTPKQVETLLALVERPGEIVSKEVLMNRLWRDAAVEESNLVQNIYLLRKILGKTSGGKPMIETLRRRGYRFNGELQHKPAPPSKEDSDNGTEPPTDTESQYLVTDESTIEQTAAIPLFQSRGTVAGLGAILLIAIVVLGYLLIGPRISTAGNDGKTKIAVLPSKPMDANNRDNLYEVGVADAIISSLSQVKGFEVRSLNAVRYYNGIDQDPVVAGREQNVDYVLAPNYQLSGGKIRITAPLIDVASGKVEDTYKFENEATSHFAVQDAVAAKFGSDLMRRFARTSTGPAAKRGTDNEEAYQLYQQAMYLADKKRSREVMPKAIEYLDQAVSLDPNYAQAWAGKALAHMWAYDSYSDQQYQRSMEALEKALAIDPNLTEAYSALCQNKFTYEYDFAGAEAACKRAIELGPNSSIARQVYSHFLVTRDRGEEALAEIKTAIGLEPASYFNKRIYANNFYFARRFDEAIAQYKQLIEQDPTNIGTYNWIIRALEAQGNEPEAFQWFIRSLTLQERDQKTIQRFRDAYRDLGWRGVLLERINTPEADRGSTNPFRLAGLYARLGDNDKAFEYLEECYRKRDSFLPLLRREPQFDAIRDDPRYDDLVRRIEGH